MKLQTVKLIKASYLIAFVLMMCGLHLPTQVSAQLQVFNNQKIRSGNGNENSVNTSGNLQQLFYFNTGMNSWRQLTFGNTPLDNAIGVGGDKTNEWNTNGSIAYSTQLGNQVIDRSRFVATSNNTGYGTIISKGNVNVGGSLMELETSYTLPQNSAYFEIKVKVTNISTAPVENVRLWVGTRDDYVGNNDRPRKEKGNLVNGMFVRNSSPSAKGAALQISTAQEGVLVYTNSTRGNTIIQGCCSFSNVVQQNPTTSTTDVTNDGSYGFYVRLNDLPVGASDDFTWYYAAGELAQLPEIIREVASVSGSISNIKSTSATFKGTSSSAATGYWMAVPRNAAAPTAAQIKAGANYNGVVVAARGASAMAANAETTFQMTGLNPATAYDFHFVSEDGNSRFSDIYRTNFTTNSLPAITAIPNQTTCQDVAVAPIGFTVSDVETAAGSLVVTATTSNPTLVPAQQIVLSGTEANRSISLIPATGQHGVSTITVTIRDAAGEEATRAFTLTVNQNTTPMPTVQPVTYRVGNTATALSAQGTNLKWYTSATGGAGTSVAPVPSATQTGIQEYWVSQTTSGCESARAKITVTVLPANALPTDITLAATAIDENVPVGTIVGNFTTADADQSDVQTYTLVSGAGSQDNAAFEINGNDLVLKMSPDYETKHTYSLRVKTDDGKGGTFEKSFTISINDIDEIAPTLVSVLRQNPSRLLTNAAMVVFQVSFSEAVTGVDMSKFTLVKTGTASGTISTIVQGSSAAVYLVSVGSVSGDGNLELVLNKNAAGIIDQAGNAFAYGQFTAEHYAIKTSLPIISGVTHGGIYNTTKIVHFNEGTGLLNNNPFVSGTSVGEGTYTLVVTDEAGNTSTASFIIDTTAPVVTGIANNGIYNSNRTISFNEGTATLNGQTFANNTTVTLEGNHTLVVTDAAGNSATVGFVLDKTAPLATLAINQVAAYTNAAAVALHITAEDASTDPLEMRLSNDATTWSNWETLIAAKAWNLASGDGQKVVFLQVRDAAGNVTTTKQGIKLDTVRPTVSLSTTAANPVNAAFAVTITFSESVSGFTLADVQVQNGAASDFEQVTERIYQLLVTPVRDGDVTVQVAANVAEDAAANGNTAANALTILYDVSAPTVTLATLAPATINAPFNVQVQFDEPVTGFSLADLAVTNATVSALTTINLMHYTVLVTPTADGTVTVRVVELAANDQAGNGNEASEVLSREYDATKPRVVITAEAGELVNAPFNITVTFSEAVSGFEASHLQLTNATVSSFEAASETRYTAVVTPVADGEVHVQVSANAAFDIAQNGNEASAVQQKTYDGTAPAGYAVAFNVNLAHVYNLENVLLHVTGAELGTTFQYSIEDEKGEKVTGNDSVTEEAFTLSNLGLAGLADGMLTVSLYLTDAATNKGAIVKAETLKVTRNIVQVAVPAIIKVPIRTTYAQVPLPAKVEVTYSTGDKEEVEVSWSAGAYNGLVAGPYELAGVLHLASLTTNLDNISASVIVEVQPNKVPTALAFSATTFKPEAAADEVIGTLATTDPDDTEFVYTLATGQGDTHNHLFEIRGDQVYLKSNKGLSGMTSFTIRVRSTDPYLNTIERTFTLTKQAYDRTVDQLKIVNVFSPNNDGINDNWTIPELRFYNKVHIQVFDRSGVRVFETNDPEKGWDGRGQNGQILKGAFLFIVEVQDINWVKRGTVTILGK